MQGKILATMAVKVRNVDGGACMAFTPLNPKDHDLISSAIGEYFYNLTPKSCASM